MVKYMVNIWGGPAGKAYSMEFDDVQNEMEAAAVAVNHYLATIPNLDAETIIDSSPVGVAPRPMKLRDLIGWLRKSEEGRAFVEKENLQALVTRFAFD